MEIKDLENYLRDKLNQSMTLSMEVKEYEESQGVTKLAFEAGKYSAYAEMLVMIRKAEKEDSKCI